jgi:hypothetical protein
MGKGASGASFDKLRTNGERSFDKLRMNGDPSFDKLGTNGMESMVGFDKLGETGWNQRGTVALRIASTVSLTIRSTPS